ncbi:MAG: hypothetical protein KGJ62_09305 [Armatimonadetes bacterium]|nr:hypothetical protein [Armatimonadota bacterium]MDE2207441.1 hypothetical protein [Armatimonadota bacterium]
MLPIALTALLSFAPPSSIRLRSDTAAIGMGRTAAVSAEVRDARGRAVPGAELWPYVNGKQWGAPARSGPAGKALLLLPLPNVGAAEIEALITPQTAPDPAHWIWSNVTLDNQTVFITRRFNLKFRATLAQLDITCDDSFQAWINGRRVAAGSDYHAVQHAAVPASVLHAGSNILTVEAHNGSGPAGLLARLAIRGRGATRSLATDRSWSVSSSQPAGWPENVAPSGKPATEIATVGGGVWGRTITGWPGMKAMDPFRVGEPAPAGSLRSNSITIRVRSRTIHRPPLDPNHLVGMEWEPWFTPLNARWDTAEAVPELGDYSSFDRSVIRQHALWLTEAGIDYLLIDWSNNLWSKKHWRERDPGVDELIRSTTETLDVFAAMRKEGVSVPRVTLLLGLDNGPPTTTEALHEEMDWVYAHYVRNSKYSGLWLHYLGKPLIVPFDGGGPAFRATMPPLASTPFTVRWMGSQFQANHLAQAGYWSWMDGSLLPIVTSFEGMPEALTITPAYFGAGGWTYPQARGRLGGSTYLTQWQYAMRVRPRFLLINQWNEFAGQPKGGGGGPNKDQFEDCYTPELSDDIEPTSLTAHGYRGSGGWGYQYYNLTKALVRMYHEPHPATTLIALEHPTSGEMVHGPWLLVRWRVAGRAPAGYNVNLDGKRIATHIATDGFRIDLRRLSPGRHRIEVAALGASSRYPIGLLHEDAVRTKPAAVSVTARFVVALHGR